MNKSQCKPNPRIHELLNFLAFSGLFFVFVWFSVTSLTQLQSLQKNKVLRVATINGPMTWYFKQGQAAGFEYELVQALAHELGVEFEFVLATDESHLLDLLRNRDVHLVAANLTKTEHRLQQFMAAPVYRQVAPVLFYKQTQGRPSPKKIEDLQGSQIGIVGDYFQAENVTKLKSLLAADTLDLHTHYFDSSEILKAVYEAQLDYGVIDNAAFAAQASYYPGTHVAFDLPLEEEVSWFINEQADHSLSLALKAFFQKRTTRLLINRLEQHYFSGVNPLNEYDINWFRRHFEERFLDYEPLFQQASDTSGLNFSLLAALAYQESRWNKEAVSPTGVRGIMMITQAAAKDLGLSDRVDPQQSILGGAEYLRRMLNRLPESIRSEDRIWFALAAYNVGLGHIFDARQLTERLGGNPDHWLDIREHLPKLAQRKYFSTLRYGYARGHEPVVYVDNIQNYMEVFEREYPLFMAQYRREDEVQDVSDTVSSEQEESDRLERYFSPSL